MPAPESHPARGGVPGDWRSDLERLTAGDEAAPAEHERPLGLQFELRRRVIRRPGQFQGARDEPARRAASVDRLGVRPVTRGARGAWIKAGLTWQNIAYQGESGGYDPAQARWFAQFAALKGAPPGGIPTWGSELITIDEYASPLLWALLAEARRLGIHLVGADATPDVRLADTAWVGLDAAVGGDGGLVLAPSLEIDGVATTAQHARAVGGHGVYRFDFDDGTVELAPVAGGLTPAQVALLGTADPLRVPAADLDEFLRAHSRALARSVPIGSRDGSFTPPAAPPAELALTATHGPGGSLGLAWAWDHGDGRVSPLAASVDPVRFDGEPVAARDAVVAAALDVLDGFEGDRPGTAERIRAALEHARDDEVELHDADAAAFADDVLPRLEAIDRVRVDLVGDPPDYRELAERPTLAVTTVESRQADWFDLGVIVTVAGRQVPFLPLFRALSNGARRLKLVDNSYLSLRRPEFDALRELLDEAGTLAEWETGLRLHRARASLWADFEDLADVAEPAVSWRATVAALADDAAVEPLPQPAGLALPLRPYQLDGFRWLAFLWRHRLGGILADDMGLGKTAQALALIQHAVDAAGRGAPAEGRSVSRPPADEGLETRSTPSSAPRPAGAARAFLVVAPTSVASNWVREAARFTPGLRVASVTATEGAGRPTVAEVAATADVVITTYAVLRLDADAFGALEWGGLVLDEAQFVKNPATKAHEAARGIRAPFRLAVTGTPVENHLGELWAIMNLVAPGLFPSRRAFDERYRRPIEEDGNAERRDLLRRRIRPLMLRRTKEAVAPELPAKQEQVLTVALAPRHRRLYDATLQRERQKLLDLLDDDLDRQRFIVYRSLTLLRMLALDASLIDERHAGIPSAKLDALFEQLDDVLAEGHRALVFSQFTSFLGRVAGRLDAAGVPYAYLDGSTPARARDEQIARFRSGAASVFCISLKAGGFGLNLTEADYVFLLDPWWNPASEQQAVDRAHRIGQERRVMVYRLVAEGTIEEKVMALKARKGELVASVLDGDPGVVAESGATDAALTAADVRELLDG